MLYLYLTHKIIFNFFDLLIKFINSGLHVNGESEHDRDSAGEQHAPPRQLERLVVVLAGEDDERNVGDEDDNEPPHGHFLVPLHEL